MGQRHGNILGSTKNSTWVISISELSFACKEENKIIKARVCGGELEVHFSERKIVMSKLEKSGCLKWDKVVDGNGTPLRSSSALPWRRVEVSGTNGST